MKRRSVAEGVYRYELERKPGRKTAEVRYGAVVDVGTGYKRDQRRKEGFLKEADAKAWRAAQLLAARTGTLTTGMDKPLGVWVEEYIALRSGSWAFATQRNQRWTLELFEPLFNTPLGRVSTADIAVLLSRLEATYSPGTLRCARAILSSCLGTAVSLGLINKNPVVGTRPAPMPRTKDRYWDAEMVRRLLAACADDELHGGVLHLIAETWMRVGEACGLTWADVDLGQRVVRVARTVRLGPDGLELGDTVKTANAARVLPITDRMMRRLRDRLDRDRLREGRAWHDGRCVFHSGLGGPLNPGVVRYRMAQFCRAADLPVEGPHMLRHAGASMAIRGDAARGIDKLDPKLVSERLGHASVKFTLDKYVHPNQEDHRKATDVMDSLLFGVS